MGWMHVPHRTKTFPKVMGCTYFEKKKNQDWMHADASEMLPSELKSRNEGEANTKWRQEEELCHQWAGW